MRELIEEAAERLEAEEASEADIQEFERHLSETVPQALLEVVPRLVDSVKRSAPDMLRDRRSRRAAYSALIQEHWKEAFDLYETVLRIAFEVGEDHARARLAEERPLNPVVGPIVTRLQGRACRIAEEVLVLMKAGYAQAALARWRALHEVSVVASFIAKHGPETGRRYVAHEHVESYWAIQDYLTCQPRLGYEPVEPEELAAAEARFEAVLEEFGPAFKKQYGWAEDVITRDPTLNEVGVGIRALEKDVGLDHFRAHYRHASHPVHPQAKGTLADPDLMPELAGGILAGPAPRGMADPGHGALISLTQVTCTLLMLKAGASAIVYMQLLLNLSDEAGDAFLAAQTRLEEIGSDGFSTPDTS